MRGGDWGNLAELMREAGRLEEVANFHSSPDDVIGGGGHNRVD